MKVNLPKNQTHSDFYKILRDYGINILRSITKNGIGDWLPADNATFKLIYPLVLDTLNKTLAEDKNTSNDTSTNNSCNGFDHATGGDGHLSEGDTSADSLISNLIMIVGFFQKQTYLSFNDFKKLFYQVFPSKNLTVTQFDNNNNNEKDYLIVSRSDSNSFNLFTYETINSIFDKLKDCKNYNVSIVFVSSQYNIYVLINN